MTAEPPPKIYAVTFRAEEHDVPAILRLRELLKRALRDYGLRCVRLRADRPIILDED